MAREKQYEIRDDVISGLGLTIQPSGVRTYFLARTVRGRRRYVRIGNAREQRRRPCGNRVMARP